MPVINAFFINEWILEFRLLGEYGLAGFRHRSQLAIRKATFLAGPVQLHALTGHEAEIFAFMRSKTSADLRSALAVLTSAF
jgi:hypothetical protein